jgi:hypothetical protein
MALVTTDASALVVAEIFLDPSIKEEADRAFAGCQAEDVRIVTGTAIALVGSGLSLVCAVILVSRQDWWDRPALGLLASTLVAAYGVIVSHAADTRREMHLSTLRMKRPYIVSSEAEAALHRIQSARLELRSFDAPGAGVERLLSQAWRLIRALDAATPTWRFDDPELTRLRVVQKSRRAEHAALIALADRADQMVADAVQDATTEAGSPEATEPAEPEPVPAAGDPEPDPELAEANREAIKTTDPMAIAALIAHGIAPEVSDLELALGRQDHTL